MAIHELIDLDFAPGIKAEHINHNFELIYSWMKRERLRVGGWGIVEGFKLTCDPDDFTVHVGEGIFINKNGEEVTVPERTFGSGEVSYRTVSRVYRVDAEGKITLEDPPYNHRKRKYITYNPPNTTEGIDEDILLVTDPDGFYVPIVRVIGKNIWVNAKEYGNTQVSVTQIVASDRIDTIMLHMNGEYEYLWSIDSPSPSHVDMGDFEDSLCVAVVYWTITEEGVNCDFFINHRSYRRVYVDDKNVLYLNGEVYKKPKYIYFEEPDLEDREINDLWYNVKDNTLYIWRYRDGELGWVIVNDHSEIVIKERYVWYPEDNPKDLKTFKFRDEDLNLRFVPGTNALDVLVDNAPIMDDQYEELQIPKHEVSEMEEKIKELNENLAEREAEYEELEKSRKNIEGTIHVLRKDIADSYALYPKMYEDGTYQIDNDDIPNLRNIMEINQKVAKALEDLAQLMVKLDSVKTLIESYEEQIDVIKSITDGTYVSTGCGFQLKEPLSHRAFVEVTVTHVVRMKPARETFQRAAIFIKEGDICVPEEDTQYFETGAAYSVGDDQLEVFVDGKRLSRGLDEFSEVVEEVDGTGKRFVGGSMIDYRYGFEEHEQKYRSTSSRTFKVNDYLHAGQIVTYKISKHVWSYDQLDKLISNIRSHAETALADASKALAIVTDVEDNVNNAILGVYDDINIVKSEVKKVGNCYKKGDTVNFADMPVEVRTNVIGAPIHVMDYAMSNPIKIKGIHVEYEYDTFGHKITTGGDIFEIHYINGENSRILVREGTVPDEDLIDYWYDSIENGETLQIELRDDLLSSDAYIYVVGYKRGIQ